MTLLGKGPYALDVSNTASGREHSPCAASPSSEMGALHLEKKEPLRLSPVLPGEGGRGSGGPANPLHRQISNEGRESSYDRLTDPPRAPADPGPRSPVTSMGTGP